MILPRPAPPFPKANGPRDERNPCSYSSSGRWFAGRGAAPPAPRAGATASISASISSTVARYGHKSPAAVPSPPACLEALGTSRPHDPSLRDRGNRKRVLALQKPLSKLKPKIHITRAWSTLCNPSQRRAGQALIVYKGLRLDADKGPILRAD